MQELRADLNATAELRSQSWPCMAKAPMKTANLPALGEVLNPVGGLVTLPFLTVSENYMHIGGQVISQSHTVAPFQIWVLSDILTLGIDFEKHNCYNLAIEAWTLQVLLDMFYWYP